MQGIRGALARVALLKDLEGETVIGPPAESKETWNGMIKRPNTPSLPSTFIGVPSSLAWT
jgi:hypothetical protein